MQSVGRRAVLALVAALSLASVGETRAMTIATFADPSNGVAPLFTVDLLGQTIEATWDNPPGLTLQTFAGTFDDVSFDMPQLSFDGSFNTGAGHVEFLDQNDALLFRIDFGSAHLTNPLSFGATEFLSLNQVDFSGPLVAPPGIVDGTESFSFAFANQTGSESRYTATAAFNSSAQLVPEPTTLAALGVLTALAIGRRRR